MTRFTKDRRQEIVREFATRHNGQYNPSLFFEEVRTTGESHPAYDWFEWDLDKAALSYQIEQAREFARDLRVVFRIEEVGRKQAITVREASVPFVLSPMGGRRSGGGYYLVDLTDPSHMIEHCQQAAVALRAWLNRYEAALLHEGIAKTQIEAVANKLEKAALPAMAAA